MLRNFWLCELSEGGENFSQKEIILEAKLLFHAHVANLLQFFLPNKIVIFDFVFFVYLLKTKISKFLLDMNGLRNQ